MTWSVADVLAPTLGRELTRRLYAVAITGIAFAMVGYLASAALAATHSWHSSFVESPAAIHLAALAIALVAAVLACREQLAVQPRSLALPLANAALLLAAITGLATSFDLDAGLTADWLAAGASVQLLALPVLLRLWSMLAFSISAVKAGQRSRNAARAALERDDLTKVVVRVAASERDDLVLKLRGRTEDRSLRIRRALLPESVEPVATVGSWLIIDMPDIHRSDDGWRVVALRDAAYVGVDPSGPPLALWRGETLVGALVVLGYQVASVALAYGVALLR